MFGKAIFCAPVSTLFFFLALLTLLYTKLTNTPANIATIATPTTLKTENRVWVGASKLSAAFAAKSTAPSKTVSQEIPVNPTWQKQRPLWQRPRAEQSLMHCFALSLAVPQSSPVCASSHTHFPLEHAPCPLQTCWFSPRTHCFLFWQASPSNSVEQKHFPYRHSPCLLHSFGHATFFSHCGPSNPGWQKQRPYLHSPRPPHMFGPQSKAFSQDRPTKPTSHAQTCCPLSSCLHFPCLLQVSSHFPETMVAPFALNLACFTRSSWDSFASEYLAPDNNGPCVFLSSSRRTSIAWAVEPYFAPVVIGPILPRVSLLGPPARRGCSPSTGIFGWFKMPQSSPS